MDADDYFRYKVTDLLMDITQTGGAISQILKHLPLQNSERYAPTSHPVFLERVCLLNYIKLNQARYRVISVISKETVFSFLTATTPHRECQHSVKLIAYAITD
ncbi:hypothetical protein TNIN_352791 [Trichonephila inaurata madagascariensis]|uniref:Uncharacterized protein n=1 Tax=Trichonephila inaurata madagascariensis TaxID=2747483 RepID=A0A8X6YLH1_9ARAC|nr:hypothetical protein TNIN_352791 [Trichonephila inaurata madagascariensis]